MSPTPNPTPAYPHADIAAAVARALRKADDPPRPVPDSLHSPGKYAALSQNFRTSAWQHLDAADLPQASNKAWGMVAETIKAVSAQHGGFIHKHHGTLEVAWELARLARNAGDLETARLINRTIMIANQLHANFYEDDLPEDGVLEGLIDCEELSALLYARFWPDGAPAA